MKVFEGFGWRRGNGFPDFQNKVVKDKDDMRGVVLATGAPIFAKENIFGAMNNLDAPMFAVEFQ